LPCLGWEVCTTEPVVADWLRWGSTRTIWHPRRFWLRLEFPTGDGSAHRERLPQNAWVEGGARVADSAQIADSLASSLCQGRTGLPWDRSGPIHIPKAQPMSILTGTWRAVKYDVSRDSIGCSLITEVLPSPNRRCRPDCPHQARWCGLDWHEGLGLAIADTLRPAVRGIPVCTRHQWDERPALRVRTSIFRYGNDARLESRALPSLGPRAEGRRQSTCICSLEGERSRP